MTVEIGAGAGGDIVITVVASPSVLGPFDLTSEIAATVTDNRGQGGEGASRITIAGALLGPRDRTRADLVLRGAQPVFEQLVAVDLEDLDVEHDLPISFCR